MLSPPLIFSNNTHRKSGFTLVELSIVLVIIGLIIGGVLVGQDLIYAANVRAQITQIEQLETAINTFKVKYNCLPGDCLNAQDFFGTTSPAGDAINNGNGDGRIMGNPAYYSGGYTGSATCLLEGISSEVSQLFLHLYLAGLGKDHTSGAFYPGSNPTIGIEFPYAKLGNGTGIVVSCLADLEQGAPTFLQDGNAIVVGIGASNATYNASRLGYSTGSYGILNGFSYGNNGHAQILNPIGIPADVARRIDEKIDDGLPSSGKFGIIAGSDDVCNNVYGANAYTHVLNHPLVATYPAPSVSCNTTVGKRID